MPFKPNPNVVSEVVVFNGRTYRRYPNATQPAHRRYFSRSGGHGALHRDIWEHYNGPIPAGYDVHHKNEDWSNNDISNLELLPKREHCKKHAQFTSEFNSRFEQLEHLARIREKAADWHSSEEGKKWHAENTTKHFQRGGAAHEALAKAREERRKNPFKLSCVQCGSVFEALIRRAKYCSVACTCRAYKLRKRTAASV